MLFQTIILNLYNFVLYILLGAMIWEVLTRRFLIEKIFSLILVFILLAFCLLLSGLEFLPLVILLLYVGAIAVLFLFVVMILNPDFQILLQEKKELLQAWEKKLNSNPTENNDNNQSFKEPAAQEYFSPVFLGVLLGLFLSINLFSKNFILLNLNNNFVRQQNIIMDLQVNFFEKYDFAWPLLQKVYAPMYHEHLELVQIGFYLYTKYSVGLVIIGTMLLVALIGAIVLTLKQSPVLKRQNIGLQAKRYRYLQHDYLNNKE